jgi:hypothetical protein
MAFLVDANKQFLKEFTSGAILDYWKLFTGFRSHVNGWALLPEIQFLCYTV